MSLKQFHQNNVFYKKYYFGFFIDCLHGSPFRQHKCSPRRLLHLLTVDVSCSWFIALCDDKYKGLLQHLVVHFHFQETGFKKNSRNQNSRD